MLIIVEKVKITDTIIDNQYIKNIIVIKLYILSNVFFAIYPNSYHFLYIIYFSILPFWESSISNKVDVYRLVTEIINYQR